MTLPTTTFPSGRLTSASGPPGADAVTRELDDDAVAAAAQRAGAVEHASGADHVSTISQRSPPVLVMPWTVPRIRLRSTRTSLAKSR